MDESQKYFTSDKAGLKNAYKCWGWGHEPNFQFYFSTSSPQKRLVWGWISVFLIIQIQDVSVSKRNKPSKSQHLTFWNWPIQAIVVSVEACVPIVDPFVSFFGQV